MDQESGKLSWKAIFVGPILLVLYGIFISFVAIDRCGGTIGFLGGCLPNFVGLLNLLISVGAPVWFGVLAFFIARHEERPKIINIIITVVLGILIIIIAQGYFGFAHDTIAQYDGAKDDFNYKVFKLGPSYVESCSNPTTYTNYPKQPSLTMDFGEWQHIVWTDPKPYNLGTFFKKRTEKQSFSASSLSLETYPGKSCIEEMSKLTTKAAKENRNSELCNGLGKEKTLSCIQELFFLWKDNSLCKAVSNEIRSECFEITMGRFITEEIIPAVEKLDKTIEYERDLLEFYVSKLQEMAYNCREKTQCQTYSPCGKVVGSCQSSCADDQLRMKDTPTCTYEAFCCIDIPKV